MLFRILENLLIRRYSVRHVVDEPSSVIKMDEIFGLQISI